MSPQLSLISTSVKNYDSMYYDWKVGRLVSSKLDYLLVQGLSTACDIMQKVQRVRLRRKLQLILGKGLA